MIKQQIMNLTERDLKCIWHPFAVSESMKNPIPVDRGEGARLYDPDGSEYIDAISSWWVNTHGHAHPYITEKISRQLDKLHHVIFSGFTHEAAVETAEKLLRVLPQDHSKVFFSDDGSTAVAVAIKMAIQYWHNKAQPRKTVIAFENAYHGDTFGAMSLSGRDEFTRPFEPFLFDVIHIPAPLEGKESDSLRDLEAAVAKSKPAAFIYEPLVQGTAGMICHTAKGLNDLLEFCRLHNIITVADEVMTGFGRTGKYFASDYMETKPDIICLSKGLTGGAFPLGATSCREFIYEEFNSKGASKAFFHGHSYTGNPLACTAASASLDLMEKPECFENIRRISEKHLNFKDALLNNPRASNCRGLGTIFAFDVKNTEHTSYFNSARDKLYSFFLKHRILLRPLGNVVYILPPYCITSSELDRVYTCILKALDELEL